MNESRFQFITPSDVIEYIYCPRFLYFMHVLHIEQQEHKRFLVNKGRDIHELKMVQNKEYLRKKIGCTDKEVDVYLTSPKLRLVGRMDEVLFFDNNLAAPLDYKYAFWENTIYKTLQMQQTLYALLIEEHYQVAVKSAYIVYVRSKNHLEEISISDKLKKEALQVMNEMFDVLDLNYFPTATARKKRCQDCTYRNICIQ